MKKINVLILIFSLFFSPNFLASLNAACQKESEENCYYAISYFTDTATVPYYKDSDFPFQIGCYFLSDTCNIFSLGIPNITDGDDFEEVITKYQNKCVLIYLEHPFEEYDFKTELIKPTKIEIVGRYFYGIVEEINGNEVVFSPYAGHADYIQCVIMPDTIIEFYDGNDSIKIGDGYELAYDEEGRLIWISQADG